MADEDNHAVSIAVLKEQYRNIDSAMAKINAKLDDVATRDDLKDLVTHGEFLGLKITVESQGKKLDTLADELKKEGLSNFGERAKGWAMIVAAIAGGGAAIAAMAGWIRP